MNGKMLVAGIGNIFLGDDAFGVEVAQRLSQRVLPESVVVKDFGIRSYDLAYALMEDWELAILVDALPRGGVPGTVYIIEPNIPADQPPATLDAHSMDPVAVLKLVSALGGRTCPLFVVGCEPANIEAGQEGNMGLSAPVFAAVDESITVIEELIAGAHSKKKTA